MVQTWIRPVMPAAAICSLTVATLLSGVLAMLPRLPVCGILTCQVVKSGVLSVRKFAVITLPLAKSVTLAEIYPWLVIPSRVITSVGT